MRVAAGTGADRDLSDLEVPTDYEAAAGDPSAIYYPLQQAYARLFGDLRAGTASVPTFADAVVRHRMLAAIERSAATGERQALG